MISDYNYLDSQTLEKPSILLFLDFSCTGENLCCFVGI